jgi:hypothetical protein
MTRHPSSKRNNNDNDDKTAAAPQPLSEEQKQERRMQEILQIYSPDNRESMRKRILQRKEQKRRK